MVACCDARDALRAAFALAPRVDGANTSGSATQPSFDELPLHGAAADEPASGLSDLTAHLFTTQLRGVRLQQQQGQEETAGVTSIGTIVGVQPASPSGVLLLAVVVTALALVLLLFEIFAPVHPWGTAKGVKEPTAAGTAEPPTASAAASSTAAASRQAKGKAKPPPPEFDDYYYDYYKEAEAAKPASVGWAGHKWVILLSNALSVAAADLFFNMPGTFVTGEVQKFGFGSGFAGLYISAAGWLAIASRGMLTSLAPLMSMTDLQRLAAAAFALAATPQGFANLFSGEYSAGFVLVLLVPRVCEGLPFGLLEASATALVNRAFAVEELGAANALLMTLRQAVITLSAPVGGLLYEAAGFTLPYAVVGLCGVVSVPALRYLVHARSTHVGAPAPSGSLLVAISIPAVLATELELILLLGVAASWDVSLQPWLGVAPYAWTPAHISTVWLVMGISTFVATPLVAVPLHSRVGDLPLAVLGIVLHATSSLFVGTPPLLFPSLASSLPWLPYVTLTAQSIGAALVGLPLYALTMKALIREGGMRQADAAVPAGKRAPHPPAHAPSECLAPSRRASLAQHPGASSPRVISSHGRVTAAQSLTLARRAPRRCPLAGVLLAVTPYVGYSLGPLLAGHLVEYHGVATLGVVMFALSVLAGALWLAVAWPLLVHSRDEGYGPGGSSARKAAAARARAEEEEERAERSGGPETRARAFDL